MMWCTGSIKTVKQTGASRLAPGEIRRSLVAPVAKLIGVGRMLNKCVT